MRQATHGRNGRAPKPDVRGSLSKRRQHTRRHMRSSVLNLLQAFVAARNERVYASFDKCRQRGLGMGLRDCGMTIFKKRGDIYLEKSYRRVMGEETGEQTHDEVMNKVRELTSRLNALPPVHPATSLRWDRTKYASSSRGDTFQGA